MEKRKKKSSIRGGTPNGKYIRIIFHFCEPFPYKQCSLKWPNLGTMATEIEIVNRFDELICETRCEEFSEHAAGLIYEILRQLLGTQKQTF